MRTSHRTHPDMASLALEEISAEVLKDIALQLGLDEPAATAAAPKRGKTPLKGKAQTGRARPKGEQQLFVSIGRKGGPEYELNVEDLVKTIRGALERVSLANDLLVVPNSRPELSPVLTSVCQRLPDLVADRRQEVREDRISALIDIYLGQDPLAAPMAEIEADNARARAEYLRAVPTFTAEQVARLAGHGATNTSATATRWKAQRKIFGIRSPRGNEVYPGFQFQDGAPRAVIRETLAALPADMTPWQIAFWFAAPNGWLGGEAPIDALSKEGQLVEAATREGDVWAG